MIKNNFYKYLQVIEQYLVPPEKKQNPLPFSTLPKSDNIIDLIKKKL
jgi:hypothetical protein